MKRSIARRELPLRVAPRPGRPFPLALRDELREAILDGRLKPGARLPATRDLARQLGVARGTVVVAYESLVSEGYLRGAHGAGTFVGETLPDSWFSPEKAPATSAGPGRRAGLSTRGKRLAESPMLDAPLRAARPFRPHTPAVEAFPRARWMQLVARHARRAHAAELRDIDPRGHAPLRRAIAEHLRLVRGMRCEAGQVVVVSGVHQALDLTARLLLDPGDRVWMEDPGYFGARAVLEAAELEIVPVRVDEQGLDVAHGRKVAPRARLVYTTPAHQSPLGSTLSLERRVELLEFARRSGAYVFEDDYDSEFRYEGRPLTALQGLDAEGSVIHAGSFSKALFPGLRLGYLVLPGSLVEAFAGALATLQRYQPLLSQAVLAEFMAEGDFTRHLRKMRELYAERRETLLSALLSELGGGIEIVGQNSGFDVLARFNDELDDRAVRAQAALRGVELIPLSSYAIRPLRRGGLELGFAAVSPARIRRAVPELARAVELALRNPRGP
jgi:GntR family transcriptional regulator/MocR family aminotransferase